MTKKEIQAKNKATGIKLSEEQRRRLVYDDELDDIEVVGVYSLGMDSHGCDCKIIACRKEGRAGLFGFLARFSSEEAFCEDDEIYELEEKQVTVTQYEPTNYDGWQW